MSSTAQIMKEVPADFVTVVRDRPIPKDPLNFFQFKEGTRVILNITDNSSVWQKDLVIAERLFADMIICPFQVDTTVHNDAIEITRDILKQRMKYPGVKDNTDYELIAKTWVLPGKIHSGPDASTFLASGDKTIVQALDTNFKLINIADPIIHLLKIEVTNGVERQLVYKFLDSGFRPSLILIKWSNDLDDHIATAHCGGHLVNSGYSLLSLENGYALYLFSEQTLYDICSIKTVGVQNPFMASIIQGVTCALPEESKEKPDVAV